MRLIEYYESYMSKRKTKEKENQFIFIEGNVNNVYMFTKSFL